MRRVNSIKATLFFVVVICTLVINATMVAKAQPGPSFLVSYDFHGDPAIYEVANPELRYTIMTVGRAAIISLSKHVQLNIEVGMIGLHRFEFLDSDTNEASFDLKPSQYVRAGFQYGM